MQLNLLRANQAKNFLFMSTHEENILVILSSPSGVGKTTLTKKFNKNINLLKFLFLTQLDYLDQMKLMELIIILFQMKNLKINKGKKIL